MQGEGTQNRSRRLWKRWALLSGLPCAAVALGSVWLYEPDTRAEAVSVTAIAVVALLVFVLTMPGSMDRRRRGSDASSSDEPV
ncbi:hypothetical protein ABZ896_23055 [Streptomyces sp. NPDC047072]|uniref:hypothetical protein n=1 Tax=Streptomyces sp. NPDC047072 TaxID=3154809 RepID=UPI0033CCFEB2